MTLTGRDRREYTKQWKQRNPGRYREYQREYQRTLRKQVLEMYGDKCCQCGFSDSRALQIDHVDGGGTTHRKTVRCTRTFLREVLNDTTNRFQLLCANCNWIKRVENQEDGRTQTTGTTPEGAYNA